MNPREPRIPEPPLDTQVSASETPPQNATLHDSVTTLLDTERYADLGPLGRGGMGEVRLLHDLRIGREVACKTLHKEFSATEGLRERFLREAKIQGRLEHPAIVPVYDLGSDEQGNACFTMRRIRGRTLTEMLTARKNAGDNTALPFSRRKLLNAFVEVCLAVDYAHKHGVIHRDLKPSNVMLGDFGEVYVLDWGIARFVAPTPSVYEEPFETHEAHTTALGTPGYMAPEQIMMDPTLVDVRADVYSLGAILFEVLTGERLHQGKDRAEVLASTLHDVEARPSVRVPGTTDALDHVCVRATARNREDRYRNARELADAVELYLDGEQDRARRKLMAHQHTSSAEGALQHARSSKDANAWKHLEQAMHEALSALSLDPHAESARRIVTTVLLEPPTHAPPEAERDLESIDFQSRLAGARHLYRSMFAFLLSLPGALAVGARMPRLAGLGYFIIIAAGILGWYQYHTRRVTTVDALQYTLLGNIAITFAGLWLGPFVLVPMLSVAAVAFVSLFSTRKERFLIAALGPVPLVALLVLEAAGILPPSYQFQNGALLLLPRAFFLPATGTYVALVYLHIVTLLVITFQFGNVRDELHELRRKLFLHSWHLRKFGMPAA